MSKEEKWALSSGFCEIKNGQLLYYKTKDKSKQKIYEISDIVSIQKELKYEWVNLRFLVNGRKKKREFTFKKKEDAEEFINSVLSHSPAGKFDDQTQGIGFYDAIRRPLSIFIYVAAFILAIMAIAYGTDWIMQLLNIEEVHVPAILLLFMNGVYALGVTKCLIIIGVIGALCLLGAMVRVIKRPQARVVSVRSFQ